MKIEEILVDSSRLAADLTVEAVGDNPEYYAQAMALCFKDEYPVSMRAARVAEMSARLYPELAKPYISDIIISLPKIQVDGLKRGFCKLLVNNSIPHNDELEGTLVNFCIKALQSAKETIAVKVYAIDLLEIMTRRYPALKIELIQILESEMDRNSVGFRSKSKKMLKKLYTEVF